MARRGRLLSLLTAAALLAGCSSARDITTDAGSIGVGAAVGAATGNPLIGLAVGIGTQIAADEGFKYAERSYYGSIQDAIASAGGTTPPGEITDWAYDGILGLGAASGQVEVVRAFGVHIPCKELIYTVEQAEPEPDPDLQPESEAAADAPIGHPEPPDDAGSEPPTGGGDAAASAETPEADIFVGTVCKRDGAWQWAVSRPSTERWGGLQ